MRHCATLLLGLRPTEPERLARQEKLPEGQNAPSTSATLARRSLLSLWSYLDALEEKRGNG